VNNFLGTMDEFAIYNRSLSDAEILDQYNYGRARHADWAAGKSGTGLQFDGVDDYVNVSGAGRFGFAENNPLSVSAWVKTTTSSSMILDTRPDGNNGWMVALNWFQFNGPGVTYFRLHDGNDGKNDGNWHHLAYTWNGTMCNGSMRVYVDGVDNTASFNYQKSAPSIGTSIGQLWIGGAITSDFPDFNGTIDEVGIYNRSLSASEVLAHYNAGKAHHANWDPDGKWNGAMKFDGVNDYVNAGNSASLNMIGPMTVSAWVRFNTAPSSSSMIADKYNGASRAYSLRVANDNGPYMFEFYTGTTWATASLAGTPVPNQWYFVVGVYDVTSTKISVNGGAFNSVAGSAPWPGSNNLIIGALYDTSTAFFNGSIDEVRVWNRALSADEILQQYYSNLAKVAPDRWIFASNQSFGPTGADGIRYSAWVRDGNTWLSNQTERVIKRE
jgi:hypothetical protein